MDIVCRVWRKLLTVRSNLSDRQSDLSRPLRIPRRIAYASLLQSDSVLYQSVPVQLRWASTWNQFEPVALEIWSFSLPWKQFYFWVLKLLKLWRDHRMFVRKPLSSKWSKQSNWLKSVTLLSFPPVPREVPPRDIHQRNTEKPPRNHRRKSRWRCSVFTFVKNTI